GRRCPRRLSGRLQPSLTSSKSNNGLFCFLRYPNENARARATIIERDSGVETRSIQAKMEGSAAVAVSVTTGRPYPFERRRRLSPAALAVTNEKVLPAYSTVVINGVVRALDFTLLSIIGIAS